MNTRPAKAALLAAMTVGLCGAVAGITAALAQSPTAALYTDDQAQRGVDAYETRCGMCHGANMEGAQGPTLLGDTLTSHYPTVGDLMQFIVQNMPKNDPGSLSHDDYVDILAFILLKNGWSSGPHALTFADASQSKAALSQAQ